VPEFLTYEVFEPGFQGIFAEIDQFCAGHEFVPFSLSPIVNRLILVCVLHAGCIIIQPWVVLGIVLTVKIIQPNKQLAEYTQILLVQALDHAGLRFAPIINLLDSRFKKRIELLLGHFQHIPNPHQNRRKIPIYTMLIFQSPANIHKKA
jgi:hypothetical protein